MTYASYCRPICVWRTDRWLATAIANFRPRCSTMRPRILHEQEIVRSDRCASVIPKGRSPPPRHILRSHNLSCILTGILSAQSLGNVHGFYAYFDLGNFAQVNWMGAKSQVKKAAQQGRLSRGRERDEEQTRSQYQTLFSKPKTLPLGLIIKSSIFYTRFSAKV